MSARFPWYLRIALFFTGSGLLVLLVVAFVLKPDPSGMGTHQRLGLRPCNFQIWFGEKWGEKARCPSCGMTTSWAHMTKGQVVRSFQANSGGALLALTAVVLGPWLLISGLLGRWFFRSPDERVVLTVFITIMLVTLVDWIVRLTV